MWKVLQARMWWPPIYKDAKEYAKGSYVCQRVGKPSHHDELPLHSVISLQIFEKWEIDFIGMINLPVHRTQARYIITVTEYVTRWAEVALVKECIADTTARFIFENIISRFEFPKSLISDQVTHFINETIASLL